MSASLTMDFTADQKAKQDQYQKREKQKLDTLRLEAVAAIGDDSVVNLNTMRAVLERLAKRAGELNTELLLRY